jgi:transcriptional regulator with XRE-family HTH domain
MTPNERLRKIRIALGLTQKELAEKMGMSWYQVKDMETGKVKISNPIAKLLYYEVGANPSWLLTGKDEMFIKKQKEEEGMKPDFIDRLKKDLAGKDDSFYTSLPISKEKIENVLKGKDNLTRRKIISLARKLNKPLDEYLLLSNSIPKEVTEQLDREGTIGILRSVSNLEDDEVDELLDVLSNLLKVYARKHNK